MTSLRFHGFRWLGLALVALVWTSCSAPRAKYTPSNAIRVNHISKQNLQLAHGYHAKLQVLEQAFLEGIIDEDFYLAEKYQLRNALEEQLSLYQAYPRHIKRADLQGPKPTFLLPK